jgi:hypothetical protein
MLCGWYVYMAVLAGLTAASAPRGTQRWLAGVLAGFSVVLLVSLFWWPFGALETVALTLKLMTLVGATWITVAGRRQDTRLIALMLAFAAGLTVAFHFWQPPPGPV